MKKIYTTVIIFLLSIWVYAQLPQAVNFQAIARDGSGNPMVNTTLQIRLSVIDSVTGGTIVYQEIRSVATNAYGSFSFQIGVKPDLIPIGSFQIINWITGNKYLKIDYDPTNTQNFTLSLGTIEFVSVPYAFAAEKVVYIDASGAQNGDVLIYNSASGKFEPGSPSVDWSNVQNKPALSAVATSGDYNDLTNKPVTDGSETSVKAGTNVTVTGTGTSGNPYIINGAPTKVNIGSTQTWTVPNGVSKIKVELWGAAGGGGGAGAYSYSLYSGGSGGSGGYAEGEMNVTAGQQFTITVGLGGNAGNNATGYSLGYSSGDTDGGNGGDTWFGSASTLKAAGGTGGKKGSFSNLTVNGTPGTANIGTITGYSDGSPDNVLDVFQGLPRSYIYDRFLTSKPGAGGYYIIPYSLTNPATSGEDGFAIITFY